MLSTAKRAPATTRVSAVVNTIRLTSASLNRRRCTTRPSTSNRKAVRGPEAGIKFTSAGRGSMARMRRATSSVGVTAGFASIHPPANSVSARRRKVRPSKTRRRLTVTVRPAAMAWPSSSDGPFESKVCTACSTGGRVMREPSGISASSIWPSACARPDSATHQPPIEASVSRNQDPSRPSRRAR